MKYLVVIDDSSETGKSILNVLNNLSESDKSIIIKSLDELEQEMDDELAEKIKEGLKSEDVSRDEVMKALGKE